MVLDLSSEGRRSSPLRVTLNGGGFLDGSHDRADGNPVFGTLFGMSEHDDTVTVENEVTSELTPILIALQPRHLSPHERLGVEEQYIGMEVHPRERSTSEAECFVACSPGIKREGKGEVKAILKGRRSLPGIERDDDHRRVRPLKTIVAFGHLHEVAFTQQSTDVAQECEHDRIAAKSS